MVAIYLANKEHCTAAAIIEDGEVTSGRMPADDYKLAWLSADGWMQARTELKASVAESARKCPKGWIKR
jgi:hypothetical protein